MCLRGQGKNQILFVRMSVVRCMLCWFYLFVWWWCVSPVRSLGKRKRERGVHVLSLWSPHGIVMCRLGWVSKIAGGSCLRFPRVGTCISIPRDKDVPHVCLDSTTQTRILSMGYTRCWWPWGRVWFWFTRMLCNQ